MTWPLQFPDPQEEARKRATEFQSLSAAEQFRQLVDTIETGMSLIRESADRPTIEKMFVDREREWQEIQKELFRCHVR